MFKKIENNYNLKIKRVRCDNAGENLIVEKQCINENMKIKFEYTSPGTPQQNGRIEKKFATLCAQIRSMFVSAGTEGQLWKRLWAEAANTSAMIDNITVNQGVLKTSYKLFSGKNGPPRYACQLRTFGEIGIVMNKKVQLKRKILNREKKAMMVGYQEQSAMCVYRMYNFDTGNIIHTRNVRWTGQKYQDYESKQEWSSESSNEEEDKNERKNDKEEKEKLDEAATKRLESEVDTERNSWRDAIKKEFSDMIRRWVWRQTKRNQIPSDRRLIGNKKIFKKKKNGIYRARLVGLGYS